MKKMVCARTVVKMVKCQNEFSTVHGNTNMYNLSEKLSEHVTTIICPECPIVGIEVSIVLPKVAKLQPRANGFGSFE